MGAWDQADLQSLLRAASLPEADEASARAAGRELARALWWKAESMPASVAARYVAELSNDPAMGNLSGPAWMAFDSTIAELQRQRETR